MIFTKKTSGVALFGHKFDPSSIRAKLRPVARRKYSHTQEKVAVHGGHSPDIVSSEDGVDIVRTSAGNATNSNPPSSLLCCFLPYTIL